MLLLKRWGLLAVLVAMVPSSAGAVTLVTPAGHVARPYQRWTAHALVPTVQRIITLTVAGCPDDSDRSCFYAGPDGYRIYLNPPDIQDRATARFLLWHELGHAWDAAMVSPDFRAHFASVHGAWPTEGFANDYAMCALGISPARDRPCVSIRRAGGWFMSFSSLPLGSP